MENGINNGNVSKIRKFEKNSENSQYNSKNGFIKSSFTFINKPQYTYPLQCYMHKLNIRPRGRNN